MRTIGWGTYVGLVLAGAIALGGCNSAGSQAAAPLDPTPQAASVEERCQQGSEEIVERLETFVNGFGDISPDDFLGQDDIEGLSEFQDDVAGIIARTANQSSTLCNLDGLQVFLDAELAKIEDPGLLMSYLLASIRQGGNRERADVEVGPDDDIAAVLALLDDGSTVTLKPGEYLFDSALLFQEDLVFVGAGVDETTITSTASDAALAVFGQGKLTLRDLTVEHVGDNEASVILAFGAAIDLENVRVRGAVSNEETSGGNGILLSTGTVNEDGVTAEPAADDPAVATSRIVNSEIADNDIAGITILGELAPLIVGNIITDNALCGICYLGESAGTADQNTVSGNEFGIQVGDTSSPTVSANTVSANTVAGMVVLGTATPRITVNEIVDNSDVGIAIQAESAPQLDGNAVTGHAFALTVVGTSSPLISGTNITASDVGMQVAERANPMVSGTVITAVTGIGIVVRDDAQGTFLDTSVSGEQAVGMLAEGRSVPTIERLNVTGSEVGVSYREQAAGTLMNSTFIEPSIGVQLEDEAAPIVSANTIEGPTASGFVIRTSGAAEVRDNVISDPVSLGIGAAGSSDVLIIGNTVTGGETAISFVEEAAGDVQNNTMSGQVVAIQVGDDAAPLLANNRISDALGAALVFRDQAGGEAVENTILNPLSVAIQVVDSASPELRLNVIISGFQDPETDPENAVENDGENEGENDPENDGENDPQTDPENDGEDDPGNAAEDEGETGPETDPELGPPEAQSTVGILFAGTATGSAANNQVLGFVIGLQISDEAAPKLIENLIDGGDLLGVGILYRDLAVGEATGNSTVNHSIGVQVSDQASPLLEDNVVEQATDVAFLVQGTAQPQLDGNTCPAAIPGIGLLDQATPTLGENACQTVSG